MTARWAMAVTVVRTDNRSAMIPLTITLLHGPLRMELAFARAFIHP